MSVCTIYVAKSKALISCAVTVRAADLRLCFCICKKQVSRDTAQLVSFSITGGVSMSFLPYFQAAIRNHLSEKANYVLFYI